ncbi:MAG: tetratricopeptide repeat protein, partial [Planctomycetota bacterium]
VVFDYTNAIGERIGGEGSFPAAWRVRHANAMIDAGSYQRAIDMLAPLMETYPRSLDLKMLLIEAQLKLGQSGDVRRLIRQVEVEYDSQASGLGAYEYNVSMAMFYLLTWPDPTRAHRHARQAAEIAGEDAAGDILLHRLIGAAELVNEAANDGVARLEAISAQDAYAAYFLARHYAATDQTELAVNALNRGMAQGRSGPAYRLLQDLARQMNLPIEAAPGFGQVRRHLTAFGDLSFQMGRLPHRFLAVTLAPAASTVTVGEPIVIRATLANIGPVDVPIGDRGLTSPSLALRVTITPDQGESVTFDGLPLIIWHSPTYLPAGEVLTSSVRIDLGDLSGYLATRPLDTIRLTVEGVLDPVRQGGQLTSAVPGIDVGAIDIVRQALPGAGDDEYAALAAAVATSVTDQDPAGRLRGAAQIGSLLAMLSAHEEGALAVPDSLPVETLRQDLLAMTRRLLKDDSAAVRAEMLHEVRRARRTDRLLLVGLVLNDPSPLVRLREAELIGLTTDSPDDERLVQLSEDDDPLVARMARAMLAELRTPDPTDAPESLAPEVDESNDVSDEP